MAGRARKGPEVHNHGLTVDGIPLPQRFDVPWQRANHALKERDALPQERDAAVDPHARGAGLIDDKKNPMRRLGRPHAWELAGNCHLHVAKVLRTPILGIGEHMRPHDACCRPYSTSVGDGGLRHFSRQLLQHGIHLSPAKPHKNNTSRNGTIRRAESCFLARVVGVWLEYDEAPRRKLFLRSAEAPVSVGIELGEDLHLIQAVLGDRVRNFRNAVLGAEGHLEGEGDGATFLNTRHARGDEHVRHDHGVLISVLHDHLHFDRPGLEETRGEVGRRARRNLVDLDFEELVVGVGNGGRVGLGRGRLLELLLGGLLLHHLGQVVHLAGLVALFQEQQALDPRDLQQRGGYSIFPGVLKVHPDGVHGILRRHMRLYRHRRRQDPPLVLYKGRPKRHNALHEAPDRSLLLLRGLGAADREAHRAQDAVGSLQVQCVVGLDVVTWLRRLRNLDGVLAVGFGGDQASLAAEQHARVVAEQLRWRLHLVA
mmetsp:Transcript_19272/g.72824  ORF Transcript_19272/g.72824 Transcript_19272/m.72824 type:complete len:484 (-) Transcript_19272:93-1544(-)